MPSPSRLESPAVEAGAVRALWALPAMRTLSGLAFVGFGVFAELIGSIDRGAVLVGDVFVEISSQKRTECGEIGGSDFELATIGGHERHSGYDVSTW